MSFLAIDAETTEFVLTLDDIEETELRFAGTVEGAKACVKRMREGNEEHLRLSSDFNHPDEFSNFEDHSMDIACGERDPEDIPDVTMEQWDVEFIIFGMYHKRRVKAPTLDAARKIIEASNVLDLLRDMTVKDLAEIGQGVYSISIVEEDAPAIAA